MKKHSRAQRRHDRVRLKNKRRNHWGYGKQGWRSYCEHKRGSLYEMPADAAGMVVNTPTPCSCYMCGNPRSKNSWASGIEKVTIQERIADDSYDDGIEEAWLLLDPDPYWEMFDHEDWDFSEEDPANDWYLRWLYIK